MEIVRRGYVPKDSIEFGAKAAEKLNAAAQELVFLMDCGYDTKSASTFVGNHHLLSERQRMALARIVSTASAVQNRKRKELLQAPDYLVLDGFKEALIKSTCADLRQKFLLARKKIAGILTDFKIF